MKTKTVTQAGKNILYFLNDILKWVSRRSQTPQKIKKEGYGSAFSFAPELSNQQLKKWRDFPVKEGVSPSIIKH